MSTTETFKSQAEMDREKELEAKMAQLELETESIVEKDCSIDRNLRMLSPDQVEAEKLEKSRTGRTKEQIRRDYHRRLRQQQNDRKPMRKDQTAVDARGRPIRNSIRVTNDVMQKFQSGQLGVSNRNAVNVENLTPDQIERASKMLSSTSKK